MRYDIIFSDEALEDYQHLKATTRATVRDALERHLRHQPTKTSRSRIKRLRGLRQPQYRLRVDEMRVFYDVVDMTVHILAVIPKDQADAWLAQEGVPNETDTTFGSEE